MSATASSSDRRRADELALGAAPGNYEVVSFPLSYGGAVDGTTSPLRAEPTAHESAFLEAPGAQMATAESKAKDSAFVPLAVSPRKAARYLDVGHDAVYQL